MPERTVRGRAGRGAAKARGRAPRPTPRSANGRAAPIRGAVRILFLELRPAGYTFRLYHPGFIRSWIGGTGQQGTRGGMEPEDAAVPALEYFLRPAADEDALVLRDHRGETWPW